VTHASAEALTEHANSQHGVHRNAISDDSEGHQAKREAGDRRDAWQIARAS
jgi:hypothetical protein